MIFKVVLKLFLVNSYRSSSDIYLKKRNIWIRFRIQNIKILHFILELSISIYILDHNVNHPD